MKVSERETKFEYKHASPTRSTETHEGSITAREGVGDVRLEMWGGEHLYHISWLGTQSGRNTVAMMCVVVDTPDIPFHKWQFDCSYKDDWRRSHEGKLREVCQEIVGMAGEHVHEDDHAAIVDLLVSALMAEV